MTARRAVVDEELAKSLANRISWVAFVLAPIADTATEVGRRVAGAVADLDRLVESVRRLAQSVHPGDLEAFVDALHSIHERLGEGWAVALESGIDAHRADRLAHACRLVRSIMISLQPGALPPNGVSRPHRGPAAESRSSAFRQTRTAGDPPLAGDVLTRKPARQGP